MLFIASDQNFNRKSKNQSVLLSMLSEMGIYGILFNFELLKNRHSPECKKWLKWKKYTGITELTWRSHTFVYKGYYVWDRNLLGLNYNEESEEFDDKPFDILFLNTFAQKDGRAFSLRIQMKK